jgi:hypothetical protein
MTKRKSTRPNRLASRYVPKAGARCRTASRSCPRASSGTAKASCSWRWTWTLTTRTRWSIPARDHPHRNRSLPSLRVDGGGSMAEVDKQAERHTKASGHPTATVAVPATATTGELT